MLENFQKTIDKGVEFLAKEQEKDGSFFCLVSTKLDDYENANTVPAIVPTNIVLSSLTRIPGKKAAKIKQKAAKFLLGEKGPYWSFNYWFRKSDWYKKMPYPDDTDDTFCALAALYEYDPKIFDGAVMARIVTMLTSAEEKEGGPYDMWLVPPKARKKWKRIDLVCNANIAYFLSLQDIRLPKLDAFIDKSIDEKDYEFPYNKIYPGIYFISRFYRGKKKEQMIDLLLKNQESDGKWENPLRTALIVSSLINLEGFKHWRQIGRGIAYLLKTQNQNGSWEPYSFYFSVRTKKKTLYAGSSYITTALCLEAINKFNNFQSSISNFQSNSNAQISNSKEEEIYNQVIKNYQQRFKGFSREFQKEAKEFADKLLKKNKDIALLPYYFTRSLNTKLNSKFLPARQSFSVGGIYNSDLLIRLGEANLHGWIAYTIYDDFLDEPGSRTSAGCAFCRFAAAEVSLPGEEGDPKKLSVANVCLRESAEIFASVLPVKTGFAVFSKKIFDIIDSANMWEVTNCRIKNQELRIKNKKSKFIIHNSSFLIPDFGDYSQLAHKSLGHALGPIAVLFALGYKESSAEIKTTMQFFIHYIIARQLNDDAHDWEDDLKRGQVNAVGAWLLKDAEGKTGDVEKLRQIFWRRTVVGVCKDILKYAELAKKDLKKLSIIKEPMIFIEMLSVIERSAEEALKEREETMKFLKTYSPHVGP